MHGVWNWIADKNCQEIVEILKRKLNPGGVLQVSYNCQPGWAAMVPLQHLLKLHKAIATDKSADSRDSLKTSINFIDALCSADATFFNAYPDAKEKLEWLKTQDLTYLVHEFYNDNWPIIPFSDVADDLAKAKLTYIGPSNLLDHLDVFSLTPKHQEFLSKIGNTILKETSRDLCMSRRFRSAAHSASRV